jgi:hypothetical protein
MRLRSQPVATGESEQAKRYLAFAGFAGSFLLILAVIVFGSS